MKKEKPRVFFVDERMKQFDFCLWIKNEEREALVFCCRGYEAMWFLFAGERMKKIPGYVVCLWMK